MQTESYQSLCHVNIVTCQSNQVFL